MTTTKPTGLYLARLAPLSRLTKRVRRNLMKFLWEHPPRSAAPWTANSATPALIQAIAHLQNATVFGLECTCGATQLEAMVGHVADTFIGPLITKCAACESARIIFSRHLHGHEAEHTRRPEERDDSADLDREDGVQTIALSCPKCASRLFELAVRFDYGKKPPESGERFQDMFRAFAAYGECAGCHAVYRIGDLETA